MSARAPSLASIKKPVRPFLLASSVVSDNGQIVCSALAADAARPPAPLYVRQPVRPSVSHTLTACPTMLWSSVRSATACSHAAYCVLDRPTSLAGHRVACHAISGGAVRPSAVQFDGKCAEAAAAKRDFLSPGLIPCRRSREGGREGRRYFALFRKAKLQHSRSEKRTID